MEIRRFGPGHRRADGPPGTQGVAGQVIHHDGRARVTELAFSRYAMVTPHASPSTALFVVISGGGFVQVDGERSRINHGEAVLWPADVAHGAYTDGSEMRAIVIELLGEEDGSTRAEQLVEGRAEELARPPVTRAEGRLERPRPLRDEYDASEGEPW